MPAKFNVTASMSGNQNSRGNGQTGEVLSCACSGRLASVSKQKTGQFPLLGLVVLLKKTVPQLTSANFIIAVTLSHVCSTFARPIVVTGDLLEVRSPSGLTNITSFEYWLSDSDWLAKFGPSTCYPHYLSTQVGCDGSNIFVLHELDPEKFGDGGKKADFLRANGVVTTGTMPPFDYYRTAPLWLAYSYQDYRGSFGVMLPSTLVHPPTDSKSLLRAEATYDSHDSNFLVAASTWADGMAILSSGAEYPLPAPYQSGYKSSDFRVLSDTNVFGERVVTSFEYSVFNTKVGARDSNDLSLVYRLISTVRDIQPTGEDFLPPKLKTKTFVEDYRVPTNSGVQFVRYFAEKEWLAPDQKAFAEQVRSEVEVIKTASVAVGSRKSIIRVVAFSALVALPLVLFIRAMSKGRRHAEK